MKTGKLEIRDKEPRIIKQLILIFCLLLISYFSLPTLSYSEVLERVVAIVNDEVILLTEFEDALQSAKDSGTGLTDSEVLDEMVNRILLLEQAKRFRLQNLAIPSETSWDNDAIINKYINRRIKAFIRIPFDEIESYYLKNRGLFGKKEFHDVRDEIEVHLIETELDRRLREHIEELREKSFIRIQLED